MLLAELKYDGSCPVPVRILELIAIPVNLGSAAIHLSTPCGNASAPALYPPSRKKNTAPVGIHDVKSHTKPEQGFGGIVPHNYGIRQHRLDNRQGIRPNLGIDVSIERGSLGPNMVWPAVEGRAVSLSWLAAHKPLPEIRRTRVPTGNYT